MLKKQLLSVLIGLVGCSTITSAQNVNADVLFKNLYADRNYDADLPDVGSWSQGVSARAKAEHELNTDSALLFTGSAQYAIRLSEDKHIADIILPFDQQTQQQADDYYKIAGSLGLKYQNQQLSWGEQWVDTPFATTDYARQLATIYKGIVYKADLADQYVELGRINRFSPRHEEDFRKITVKGIESDGLNYVNYKYKWNDQYLLNAYYGNLEDLYNQIHLGADLNHQYLGFKFQSKFRLYNNQETGDKKLGKVDSDYYGFIHNISKSYHTLGLGYQEIVGDDAFPMIDTVPVLGYINWTQAMFNRAKERSVHFTYQHDFKWLVPNLTLDIKYIHGDNFKVAQHANAKEQQFDFILNYKVNEGRFNGFGVQWFNINYKNNFGDDYTENRIFTTYTKHF